MELLFVIGKENEHFSQILFQSIPNYKYLAFGASFIVKVFNESSVTLMLT